MSSSELLIFPEHLYGREKESQLLEEAYEEVGTGKGKVLLISGESGSGKTVLGQNLRNAVTLKNGFFLEGKFNQYQQEVPHFALRQALHQLIQEILTYPEHEQEAWKVKILESVADLGKLIIDLVPELELLLGPQPNVAEISPYEAPHRFMTVLKNFLKVFCQAEHPLVLFIDDWQWADPFSFSLLKALGVDSSLRYILIIAAYRDNEVSQNHPFQLTIDELKLQSVSLERLEAKQLQFDTVKQLLQDTLTPAVERLDELTRFIYQLTNGNSFFIRSLVETIVLKRQLEFNQKNQIWVWDKEDLHLESSDITQLFYDNLKTFPQACLELLPLAAYMGNNFSLSMLSLISGQTTSKCFQNLSYAIEQRVIVSISEGQQFKFRHDKVQQAAHNLIAPEQVSTLRLKIARLLEKSLELTDKKNLILEITDHYNAGRTLLSEPSEKIKLITLNIEAATKSRAATDYHAALKFHKVAKEFLEENDMASTLWQENHELAMTLYREMAETEFLEGDKENAQRCIQTASNHALSAIEKANILCVQVLQYTLLAKYSEAISAGREALRSLGIDLPENNFEIARDNEISSVFQQLKTHQLADLKTAQPMKDTTILMAIQVLITMGPPCYRADQNLWSVIVPKVVGLTIKYGPVPQIGYSHTAFAGLLSWVNNDFDTGKIFDELSEILMKRVFQNPSDHSVYYLMIGSSMRHWFEPYKKSSDDYAQAWESGILSGNLQYSAYAFGHNMYCQFFQGLPLEQFIENSKYSLEFSQSRTNQWAIDLLEGGIHIGSDLMALNSFSHAQEESFLSNLDKHNNLQVKTIYWVQREISLFILGQIEDARKVSDVAEDVIYTVGTQGLLPWPEHVFIRFIILTTQYREQDSFDKHSMSQNLESTFNKTIEQLQIWAVHSPQNYTFRLLAAKAVMAQLQNKTEQALCLFDEAIESATKEEFIHWQGILNEMVSTMLYKADMPFLAQVYWQNAYFSYYQWGANKKIKILEQSLFSTLTKKTPAYRRMQQYIVELQKQAATKVQEIENPEQSKILQELSQATESLREEVAERKRAEKELRLAASVFKHSREGIMITDDKVNIIDVNEAFSTITGYARDEVIGNKPSILKSGRQKESFYQEMWRSLDSRGYWQGEIWNKKKNGEPFAELLTVNLVSDSNGKVQNYVGLFSDITELKEHQQQLEISAYYDALTGLPNRVHFTNSLRHAMSYADRTQKRIMIVFLDLDGFKAINDQNGHDIGDQLLIKLASRMNSVLRGSDTLARLGGDEFVAVFQECSSDKNVQQIFTRLLDIISETIGINDILLQVSASIGATFYPQELDIDAEQLLRQADQAMYQAKLAGKNRYHLFDEIQDRSLRGRHEEIERIRKGLSNDEFVMYYQPKVHMRKGEILGVEALVRWQHPEQGILFPDHFLPVIENHPMIIELGEKTILMVLKQLDEWQASNINLNISVNISAQHLQQKDFIISLKVLLNHYPNVDPKYLEFEILETSALQNFDHVLNVIEECKKLGISFSLDDFGTGYSSLTYLKLLPVQTLKIDRSFVLDMIHDADDLNILEGVISLAKAFDRKGVAEGVETIEHGELLLWLGCEIGQGYGIAYPMPAEEIPQWLSAWQPHEIWLKSTTIKSEHIPILIAVIKHRTWVNSLKGFIEGSIQIAPKVDIHECQFGIWLDTTSVQMEPVIRLELNDTHNKIHDLANDLLALKDSNGKAAALEQLPQLYEVCNRLLNKLRQLVNYH